MSEAIRFLHALAQALSTMGLYSPGHPATRRGADALWEALEALLRVDEHPIFLFLGTAPVYDSRALHELSDWHHSQRLAAGGVQRLEFTREVTPEALTGLLERLMVRLTIGQAGADEREAPLPGIMFGAVAVQQETAEESAAAAAEAIGSEAAEIELDLSDELEAMQFVRTAAEGGTVARAEAEAVARLLSGLLDHYHMPQAAYDADPVRYHVAHPVNTALLAMSCAIAAGIDPVGRHRIGLVALLHDIGMARIAVGLGDRETLSSSERALLQSHTTEGARLLLDHGGPGLELAAVVAYEHHLRPDGGGYPTGGQRTAAPHWASRLVGACAAFAALRAPRPYRPAWPHDRALRYLEEGAGAVFDAEIAALVADTIRAP